jgi:hypothetical protein
MATTTTPVNTTAVGGVLTLDNADATGQLIPNTKNDVFVVLQTAGTTSNVTFTAQATARPADPRFPAQTVPNIVVAMGATELRVVGPFPSSFNDANGNLVISFSAVTNVKIGALRAA